MESYSIADRIKVIQEHYRNGEKIKIRFAQFVIILVVMVARHGTVNKQNCRIWANENPREYQEQPLWPEKCTVWCALWSKGIIGPFFSKMTLKMPLPSILNAMAAMAGLFVP